MNYLNKKKYQKRIKNQSGAAMLISVVFFLFISLAIIAGLVSPAVLDFKNVSMNLKSTQAFFLAESGGEDAFYRVVNNLPINDIENMSLNGNSVTTWVNTLSGNAKEIISLGDIDNFQRKIKMFLNTDTGISFNYGIQVGQGGLNLTGSSGIVGSVYANGPIIGTSSCYVTGTAISANSPALNANQSNGNDNPSLNISFANNNSTQDIAQSFILNESLPLNKVELYLKKIGSPSNATVKIMNNNNGNPGTTVIASGTLNSSLISNNYSWTEVSFSSEPLLLINETYWLVVDASASSSKYYIIGANQNIYGNGLGKIGHLGSSWNGSANLDYFFKIYIGGFTGLISGTNQWNQFKVGTGGSGSAQAHTVNYVNATDDIYCQNGTGNNKSCLNQTDPLYEPFPISLANINSWKNEAEIGGIYSGNYTTPSWSSSSLGPKKITGDLNVGGSHTLYLTGTVYVTGNVNISGSAKIVLHSSYGNTSGVLVSDGRLALSGSGQLNGSGQTGSYILFVTTSNCDASFCSSNAIDISGAAGSVILSAPNGTIGFTGSASAKEANAYKISLSGATSVTYESGLANVNFTSGPSGSYFLDEWKEID